MGGVGVAELRVCQRILRGLGEATTGSFSSPSCPWSLRPQAKISLSSVQTAEWQIPTAMSVTLLPSSASTTRGCGECSSEPWPSRW